MPERIVAAVIELAERKSVKIGSPRNKKIKTIYHDLAKDLSKVAEQFPAWKGDYIRSVALGNHRAGSLLEYAINKLHAQLTRKPRARPNYQGITLGNCSKKRAVEFRKAFTPAKRTEMFEKAMRLLEGE